MVLKPAEESPLSALRMAEIALDAGIPAGVFNVVPGLGATAGAALGRHPDVDCLTFTGSTEVGKKFLAYSAESNMKQVWLECGGKSPNIVFADCADLEQAAEMACFGIFGNQGEVCSANSRLLIQRDIVDEFAAALIDKAAAYLPGDPLDPASSAGAMVSRKQLDLVLRYIDRAHTDGRIILGGNRIGDTGFFLEPTVVTDLPVDSPVVTDEIFGPLLAMIPFDTEEEAVALANDTPYGWPRRCGRRASTEPCVCPRRCMPAPCRSTPSTRCRRAHRSAASRGQASARTCQSTRSTNSPASKPPGSPGAECSRAMLLAGQELAAAPATADSTRLPLSSAAPAFTAASQSSVVATAAKFEW